MEPKTDRVQQHLSPLMERLKPFVDQLTEVLRDELKGIVAYPGKGGDGSRALPGGAMVMVLVEQVTVALLNRVRPTVARWSKRLGIEPVFVTPREIETSADVFPVEFANVKAEGVFIGETDPFAQLTISREALRRQVEEDIKTKGLWLRGAFLYQGNEPRLAQDLLVQHLASLTVLFRALLALKERALPERTEEALQAVAEAYEVDADVLKEVASLQQRRPKTSQAELEGLFQRYLDVLARIAQQVNEMDETTPALEGDDA